MKGMNYAVRWQAVLLGLGVGMISVVCGCAAGAGLMAKANMDECAERIRQTEAQMEQIKAASFGYVDNSLRQTEETILKALNEVKGTRTKFQNITKPASVADSNQYDQEL